MPPVYNSTVARAVVRGSIDGQSITNTLHVDSPEAWDLGRLEQFSGVLASWLNVDYMPNLSNQYTISEIVCDSLAGINAPQVNVPDGLPMVGGNTNPALPNNVAYCVSLKTATRGRSARGRWFVAGLTESQVTGNRVSGAFRTLIVEKFEQLRGSLLASNMRMVVYSTVTLGNPRPLGVAFPVTAAVTVDDIVDSQRRRLPGRGI